MLGRGTIDTVDRLLAFKPGDQIGHSAFQRYLRPEAESLLGLGRICLAVADVSDPLLAGSQRLAVDTEASQEHVRDFVDRGGSTHSELHSPPRRDPSRMRGGYLLGNGQGKIAARSSFLRGAGAMQP